MKISELKALIAASLGTPVSSLTLQGKGMCNFAWKVVTDAGDRYLVKQERTDKEEVEANDLFTEAKLLMTLNRKHPLLPLPQVVFAHQHPSVYGYRFIDGALMRTVWPTLTDAAQQQLCQALGSLHARLSVALTQAEAQTIGIPLVRAGMPDTDTLDNLEEMLASTRVSKAHKRLLQEAYDTYSTSQEAWIAGFVHNDSHYDNILVQAQTLAGLVDFGDAQWGDVHSEFTRYALDYPAHHEYILTAYEEEGGIRLSRRRIGALAILDAPDGIDRVAAATGTALAQMLKA